MSHSEKNLEQLASENEELRRRLEEAEETIRAISSGEVDAFIIQEGQRDEQVLMLGTADRPYRLLVEKMQQGAATVTADGAIAYANRRFGELVGQPTADLIGAPIANFVTPSGHLLLEALLEQGQAGGSQGELDFQRSSGASFPAHMSVSPLLEEAGVFCLILTDLSSQKRHEALVASDTLGRSILDQAVDAIVVCDTAGQVIRASRTAQRLCTRNPLLQPFKQAFPLELGDGARLTLDTVLGGATLRGVECRLQCGSEDCLDMLASAGPVLSQEKASLGAVVILTDITKRKQLEKELRHKVEQLAEADRRKDQFLAMLAHELRNPLAPIRNGLQVLNLTGSREPTEIAVREMMGRQLENLVRMVDDLLDVSRFTQGKIKLKKEPVDLAAAVKRGIESSRPFIEKHGHRLEVALPNTPLPMEADVVRVAQIILNLLNNAAKFTPRGGTIQLSLEQETSATPETPKQATIRVRDSGVGISSDMLTRVFDLFTQVDESAGRSEGGLGIGLTLVRYLAEMHGGRVEVFSQGPGHGSEFVVHLPLLSRAIVNGNEAAAEKVFSDPGLGQEILLVDDNQDSANSLGVLLKLLGHRVRIVYDGPQALAAAAEKLPDLILLDIGLPGLNGYEVARQLRARPECQKVFVVALTGYGTEDDRRLSQAAGFDHHLVKPVDFDVLEQLLDRLTATSRNRNLN